MKKFITLLFCAITLTTISATAQQPYYDALKLRSLLNDSLKWPENATVKKAVTDILSKYCKRDSINQVFLTRNEFIKDFDELWTSKSGAAFLGGMSPGSLLGSIGNLDVTNLADGFAKFLVKRTKEELNAAFFSRFYDLIKKPEYEDARILFPQTYALLLVVGDEIYNYSVYINALRESFEKDLSGLLVNLPTVVNREKYVAFFNAHPELKATILSALYISRGLLEKTHPGVILAEYDVTILDKFQDVKAAMQTTQLFSESLRSQGTDHYWVTTDSLKLLVADPVALQLYFGLIYHQAGVDSITFSKGPLTKIMKDNLLPALNKITAYNDFLKGFIAQTTSLTQSIRNLSGKDKDKLTFTDYYAFYNDALNTIEYSAKVADLPGIKIPIPEKLSDCIAGARAAGNIAMDINRRNYSSAIINTYTLYNFVFGDKPELVVKDKNDPDKVKQLLLKYGSFMAAVAQAETSDDVAKAIEASVLPTGSSKVKRVSSFNVSINAYTGLFAGHEWIKDLEIKDTKTFNTFGVTAPIGVAASWGHSLFFFPTKAEWSTSLFISLVDLGAIAAFRFGDDTTAQVPTIQLKNIVAPGAFLSIGIPKTPLSMNFGAQMGPNLRKIDNNNTTQPSKDNNNKIYWRLSAGICVDIPLLNLYTKSK